ncbi:hypothetical protein K505DRAFT_376921 [Melanomma pulvis-pyrius CBS 109.77]|uniref:Uncharacterized protein n=1 Tax=Melanomma pulvis-pyrius CBS 109.77 TaxID=1314802 RepID=A0A6A6X533_9PLEO|nr:hypothetical protein K505DRAFT_376921 [Melanomma pulvis-pyrius CBS 109.77]
MVETRGTRSRPALPAQEPEQPTRAPRKRARKMPALSPAPELDHERGAIAGPSDTNTTRRRGLRSTKVPESPLQALEEPTRKGEKRKRASKKQPTPEPKSEHEYEPEPHLDGEHELERLDPEQGIFFKQDTIAQNEALRTENADLKAETSSVKTRSSNVKTSYDALSTAYSALQSDHDTVKMELDAINPMYDTVKTELDAVKLAYAAVKSELSTVKSELSTVKSDLSTVKTELCAVKTELCAVKTEISAVKTEISAVKSAHDTLKEDHSNDLQEPKRLHRHLAYKRADKQLGNPRPISPIETGQAGQAAYDLLEKIERSRDDAIRRQVRFNVQQEEESQEWQGGETDAALYTDQYMDDAADEQASGLEPQTPAPAGPTAAQDETPRSAGWGLKSIISRFVPTFAALVPPPAVVVAPATAPPAVLQPAQAQALSHVLAPTPHVPTPVGERRRRGSNNISPASTNYNLFTPAGESRRRGNTNATLASTKNKERLVRANHRRTMSTLIAHSVGPKERPKAKAWAKDATQKLLDSDPTTIGEKRKRLESGLKMFELKSIPARAPWEPSGTFGLNEELDELEDDDKVPAWVVLQELLNEAGLGDSPPPKRNKTEHSTTMDQDIIPLNETEAPAFDKSSSQSIIDTHGNSASLFDLHPRSSRIPSPMFSDPVGPGHHSNVFSQQEQAPSNADADAEAAAKAAENDKLDEDWLRQQRLRMKEQDRLWDKPGRSRTEAYYATQKALEEEAVKQKKKADDDVARQKAGEEASQKPAETAPLWTQQPPPAPTPAHASLPTPLTASPSVPSIQAEEPLLVPAAQSMDPVERQRAKLMKHTPVRPSRLREATIPSPSVKSDVGTESVYGGSPVKIVGEDILRAYSIPSPEQLDLGDPELNDVAEALVSSDAYKAQNITAYGGPAVQLAYDEEEIDDEL